MNENQVNPKEIDGGDLSIVRQHFEAWAKHPEQHGNFQIGRDDEFGQYEPRTNSAWMIWQGALVWQPTKVLEQRKKDVDYWIKQHTETRQAELELRRELESLKAKKEPVSTTTSNHVKNEMCYRKFHANAPNDTKLYTAPPVCKEWVGLESIREIEDVASTKRMAILMTEAKLKELNTDDEKQHAAKATWLSLTPADFLSIDQLFAHKCGNDFVLADVICTVDAKLKELNFR